MKPEEERLGRMGRDGLLAEIEKLHEELGELSAELGDERTARIILQRDYDAMLANLTATQARCTELLNEVRELRARGPS